MPLGTLIRGAWLILFAWYVVERLRVVQGQAPERPLWHNPIAAGRRFRGAFWDGRGLGLRLLLLVLWAQVLVCVARFAVICLRVGFPAELRASAVRPLLDVHPADLGRLVTLPDFWGLTWRELLDAVTLYPALQPALASEPLNLLLVGGFALWLWLRRHRLPGGPQAQQASRMAFTCLGLGGLAGVLALLSAGQRTEAAAQGVFSPAGLLPVLSQSILHGALLGLLLLVCVRALECKARPDTESRQGEEARPDASAQPAASPAARWTEREVLTLGLTWLQLVPVFCLGGMAVGMRALFEHMLPGWEASRGVVYQGVLAAMWVVTRLGWLIVLLWWLSLVLPWSAHRRAIGSPELRALAVGLARAIVPLYPALLVLALLRTLAPTQALLPGIVTLAASWLLGLTVMGGTAAIWDEARRTG